MAAKQATQAMNLVKNSAAHVYMCLCVLFLGSLRNKIFKFKFKQNALGNLHNLATNTWRRYIISSPLSSEGAARSIQARNASEHVFHAQDTWTPQDWVQWVLHSLNWSCPLLV